MRDALRLSEGMTWKSAVAGLPLGGGKGVIVVRPDEPLTGARRRDALLDFGDTVAALDGAYVTAEDVGTDTSDMTVIAERTPHVAGMAVDRGGSGDPSPSTARGVLRAIEAALEHTTGDPSPQGRRIAVVGLGHVGLPLARGLAAAGAELLVADISPARRADAEALGAQLDQVLATLQDVRTRLGDLGAWQQRAAEQRRALLAADSHGGPLAELRVLVPNRPGVVADLALTLGRAGINISDMSLSPAFDKRNGTVTLWVAVGEAERARALVAGRGLTLT